MNGRIYLSFEKKPEPGDYSGIQAAEKFKAHMAAQFIFESFLWDSTPEGGAYWAAVHAKLYAISEVDNGH
jgi:hypothetical protein